MMNGATLMLGAASLRRAARMRLSLPVPLLAALFISAATADAPAQERGQAERLGAGEPDRVDTDEDPQPKKLPDLPQGITFDMIREGDALFRGKGGCIACHGPNATGLPALGSSLTTGLAFIPVEPQAIDSLTTVGMPEPLTRTPVAMPPRGMQSNLTPEEVRNVAAYVWAIASVRGEPWPGGHETHGTVSPEAAAPPESIAGEAPPDVVAQPDTAARERQERPQRRRMD